jgi:hypothetical protein
MLNGNEENEYRHRPEYTEFVGYILFVCLMVLNATFNNISVISWRPILVVEEVAEYPERPPTMGKQLIYFITCGCESSAPFFCNLQSRV